jgi:hypothetical protein
MNLDTIVQWLDEEIDRLQRVRALLTGQTAPLKRGLPRKKVSAVSRARMAEAQTARWAKARKQSLD